MSQQRKTEPDAKDRQPTIAEGTRATPKDRGPTAEQMNSDREHRAKERRVRETTLEKAVAEDKVDLDAAITKADDALDAFLAAGAELAAMASAMRIGYRRSPASPQDAEHPIGFTQHPVGCIERAVSEALKASQEYARQCREQGGRPDFEEWCSLHNYSWVRETLDPRGVLTDETRGRRIVRINEGQTLLVKD